MKIWDILRIEGSFDSVIMLNPVAEKTCYPLQTINWSEYMTSRGGSLGKPFRFDVSAVYGHYCKTIVGSDWLNTRSLDFSMNIMQHGWFTPTFMIATR